MESVVGRNVIVQVRGQLQAAIVRAATEPLCLSSLTTDLSSTEVLLEWEGEGAEGKGRREWVSLSDASKCQALYVESKLLWAKRLITVDQQRRAVAWPSKSFTLLCSNVRQFPEIMIIEYFCDRERVRLYLQESSQETKELHLSEAKGTLISHPYLLAELEEWEESQKSHTHLLSGQANLIGHAVSFCNSQGVWPRWINAIVTAHNQQTKELTVSEEGSRTVRVVNPLLVHVVLRVAPPPSNNCGGERMQRRNSHTVQQMAPHLSNPDLLLDSSGDSALLSPHLPSPALQESTSPIFPSSLSSSSSFSPVTAYRTPSIDLHRRSSLHTVEVSSRMSEPDLFHRSSLDHQKIPSLFTYHQDSAGGYPSPLVHSPSPLLPAGPTQVGPIAGRMAGCHPQQEPSQQQLTSPQTPLQAVERSKSLENISQQLPLSHPFKRRMSAQVPLASALPSKRPRFEMVPHSMRGDMRASPEPSLPSSLQRSMSLSALSRNSRHPFTLGGRGHNSTSDNHDDELDMIKEIIDRDDTLIGPTHQHGLTGIPAELSVSLPVLHPSESLQVLHAYNSAPVIAHPAPSSSAPPTGSAPSKSSPSSTDPLLQPGLVSGLNGAISDILSDTIPHHKDITFSSDIFSFTSPPPSSSPAQPYPHTQSLNSTHLSGTTEHKSSLAAGFCSTGLGSGLGSGLGPGLASAHHPQSPILSDMLQTTPDSTHTSSLLRSALSTPVYSTSSSCSAQTKHAESAQVAREAELLCGGGGAGEGVKVVDMVRGEGVESVSEGGELDIAVVVNQHASVGGPIELSPDDTARSVGSADKETGERGKTAKKVNKELRGGAKRGRGRPRLTEEEKQRRKELRELGLMKRSHRRTKEEVAQWRAERILSPAKRGRKPGSGKKNVVKAVTGKEVYVSVDLSKYEPGVVLLQNGFCRAFPGVPRCMECGTCEGDLPSNRYCRFLEFRKIRIVDTVEATLQVEGFATYTDVQASDLVPWTPLKAGYSHMDADTALFILRRVAPQFVNVVAVEAGTLPEGEVTPVWRRAVQGLREMCDMCDTAIFNFHWICPQCGFCVCPSCYQMGWDLEEGYDVPTASHKGWSPCTANSVAHLPSSLIVAQIIPADVLSNVLLRMLKICEAHHIRQELPRPLHQLIALLSRQTPQSRFQNSRKGKGSKSRTGKSNVDSGMVEASLASPVGPLQPSPVDISPRPLPSSSSTSSLTCCPNGREERVFPAAVPQTWLCGSTLLCLNDPDHPDNMAAFQHQWQRGRPVVVAGVHRKLTRDMWTPQSFSRDFGEDYSELVDCRQSFPLPHFPSHVFWDGFEDLSRRLRDPATGEPRLLKQKDWPPGEDFCEKLPKRFEDIMAALPLPHYTRRDGKLNMASSLPDFFVKPDMGPKMYNAYGSPRHGCGTTNLHLDISDATNVMVYCSVAAGAEEDEEMIRETVKTECCEQTYWRCSSASLRVGALWHIYAASDSDRIRSFLRKVLEERGIKQVVGTDPIHDQLIYLDSELRQRLLQEHGVRGWAIAQAVGDAIFIPAGAPHQVRNLCSCIKVAEDFVSPEHVQECVKLTDEFRLLSDGHVNHEDKLQVKNIMYHSVKDIVGTLTSSVK